MLGANGGNKIFGDDQDVSHLGYSLKLETRSMLYR
jgi:hypothetical protein